MNKIIGRSDPSAERVRMLRAIPKLKPNKEAIKSKNTLGDDTFGVGNGPSYANNGGAR